jgi:hypothetical protein
VGFIIEATVMMARSDEFRTSGHCGWRFVCVMIRFIRRNYRSGKGGRRPVNVMVRATMVATMV